MYGREYVEYLEATDHEQLAKLYDETDWEIRGVQAHGIHNAACKLSRAGLDPWGAWASGITSMECSVMMCALELKRAYWSDPRHDRRKGHNNGKSTL